MRLNGKKAIMQYLGKCEANRRAWQGICLRYGHLIRMVSPHGRKNRGYWALSEEIDTHDRTTCPTVLDVELEMLQEASSTWAESVYLAKKKQARGLVAA